MNKRIIAFVCIIVVLFLIGLIVKNKLINPETLWKNYTDDKYSVSFDYPPDLYIELKSENGALFLQIHPTIVEIPSIDRPGEWDIYSPWISFVRSMDISPNMTVEEQINYKPESSKYHGIPMVYKKTDKYNKVAYQFRAKTTTVTELIDTRVVSDNGIFSFWFESPGFTPEWLAKYDQIINSFRSTKKK